MKMLGNVEVESGKLYFRLNWGYRSVIVPMTAETAGAMNAIVGGNSAVASFDTERINGNYERVVTAIEDRRDHPELTVVSGDELLVLMENQEKFDAEKAARIEPKPAETPAAANDDAPTPPAMDF